MYKDLILKIAGFALLLIFILFIVLYFDSVAYNNKFFKTFSFSFYHFTNNSFGVFSFMFISIFLFSGILLLLHNMKLESKFFLISGYISFVLFLPPFFATMNIAIVDSGSYGKNLSYFFYHIGYIGVIFLFFFWFFLSFFLLTFPFKNHIVGYLMLWIDKNIDSKTSISNKNKKEIVTNSNNIINDNKNIILKNVKLDKNNYNKQKNHEYPWLSKVIFEDNKRIESPIFPKANNKIYKFLLKNSYEDIEEYQEVDTFSGMEKENIKNEETIEKDEKNQKNNKDYYNKIKNNWPENWKNSVKKDDYSILQNDDENHEYNMDNILDDNENISFIEYDDENKINENDLKIADKMINKNSEKDLKNNSDNKIDNNLINQSLSQNINEYPQENDFNIKDNYLKEHLPGSNILNNSETINLSQFEAEQQESASILEETLLEFGIEAEVVDIVHGPVVTLYKLIPAPGIKLQKIESLSNNLALRLAAKSIRIIAPIPGEKVVGIEIPNKNRIIVNFKEITNSKEFNSSSYNVPVGLGKDIYGNIILIDLYKMPHILIAGATGSGKSVCVNSLISSILFSKTPEDVKLILIDPKIVELKPYNDIPHLLTPVITDSKDAINALKYLLFEMERRYSLLDKVGVRDIVEYRNQKKNYLNGVYEDLPFIIAIVDEFADLMSTSGKEAEILFARLAAKARAVGIHLVLATQRPSTDVITGLIKANIPARIAFQVISLQDSRIILDQKGAEKLLGQGDMLYLSPTQPFPIRLQGAFLSKKEVDLIADHWKKIGTPTYIDIMQTLQELSDQEDFENSHENSDPLFQQAIDIVYESQKASASYLQRRLGIGYNRAARIIEEMEDMGIVGPQRGSKPREIISSKPGF